ncbi:MAG: DNA-processing protein DprA [Pigmentiphaga sp.]|nr:DNA-processing protein DprA [Pigmentiphaga sp.]
MTSSSSLAHWLRLSLEPDLGPVTARALLSRFASPERLYSTDYATLAEQLPQKWAMRLSRPLDRTQHAQVARALDWAAQPDHHLLCWEDPRYPALLRATHDPPLILYAKGQLRHLAAPAIAVVGTRKPTPTGLAFTEHLASGLAQAGWTVLSGLALGIDAAAHRGALRAQPCAASTLAVVATGLDRVYPARHQRLAHQIAEQGLLLSEQALGTPAMAHQFPRRNRLVAALSYATCVIEAAPKSGSLITARLAADLGREVFAMPGPPWSPQSQGCHQLIKQGAQLLDGLGVLFDTLAPICPPPPANPPTTPAAPPDPSGLLAHLDLAPTDLDTLLERSQRPLACLQHELFELELQGQILRLPGGRYQRTPSAPPAHFHRGKNA